MSVRFLQFVASCLLLVCHISFSADNVLPYQNWKTFETQHFNIHFTPEYRDWAISAAHEMEASVKIIEQSQSRKLPEKVDVVVFDPLNDSNGFAIPFSSKPIMALYTTPPQSHSMIANSSSWQQLLSLHEYVHLVHLAQPSRNKLTQALSRYWDLYDLFFREEIQRWVAEGYATLQESRLTGRGRLYDAQVEALIHQFAREGALPKYRELNNVEGRYRIGSMAYLVGVRFLYWLEDNYSKADLDAVWTRIQAKKKRSFEQAFEGVFLESPEYLYQRFIAEYTYQVMAQEKLLGKSESQLWYNAKFDLSSPTIDPQYTRLAFIETNKKRDSVIKVVKLEPETEREQKFKEKQQELLENDPEDIAAKAPKVFNRKAEYKLQERNYAGMRNLRWFDADNIWFTAVSRDNKGLNHQDLFQWHLPSGLVTQLTEQANLRRFDISRDGRFVIAEHTKHGKSGLFKFVINGTGNKRKVDSEGQLITSFNMANVFDFPIINPNNEKQLAFLQTQPNQPWGLYLSNLTKDGSVQSNTTRVPMPEHYQFLSFPSWSKDGKRLYFVAGSGETIKLYQYELASEALYQVTKGQELVSWPIEITDADTTELLHVSIKSRGPDLFKTTVNKDQIARVTKFADLSQFAYLKKNSDEANLITDAQINLDTSIGEERDYDFWQQDVSLTLSATEASASYGSTELGIKGGDLLQRMSWSLAAMKGSHDLDSGLSANLAWQGWPVKLKAHAYQIELSDSISQNFELDYGRQAKLSGYSLIAELPYGLASTTYKGKVSASYLSNNSDLLDTKTIRVGHQQSWYLDRVKWGLSQHSHLQLLSGDTDVGVETDSWRGVQGSLGLAANAFGFGVDVTYQHAERNDSDYNLLQLGGISSGVVNQQAHANWLFSPELALGYASGNKFSNVKFSLFKRNSTWRLYYSEPKIEGDKVAEIIGLQGQAKVDAFRAGITNLAIQYGVANVKSDNNSDKFEGWLSLRYQY